MLIATASGALGRDAKYERTQSGHDLCRFSIATENGFGERKVTQWVDVTSWGKGSEGLSKLLTKGVKVTVIGELTTREHEGKTYLQMRADHVRTHLPPKTDGQRNTASEYGYSNSQAPDNSKWGDDRLDDHVPF